MDFPSKPNDKDPEPPPVRHQQLVDRIKVHVRRHNGGYLSAHRAGVWAQAVSQMERTLAKQGVDWDRILAVWTWYEKYYGTTTAGLGKLPRVMNARHFRDHWAWITEAMDRFESTRPLAFDKVPADAQAVVRRLGNWAWPEGVAEQLPAVVYRSIVALRAFLATLPAGSELAARMGTPAHFTEKWIGDYYRMYGAKITDLYHMVWRPDHPAYIQWCERSVPQRPGVRRIVRDRLIPDQVLHTAKPRTPPPVAYQPPIRDWDPGDGWDEDTD